MKTESILLSAPLSHTSPCRSVVSNDLGDNEPLEKGEEEGTSSAEVFIEATCRRIGDNGWMVLTRFHMGIHIPLHTGQVIRLPIPRTWSPGAYQLRLAVHQSSQDPTSSPALGIGASVIREGPRTLPVMLLPLISEVFSLVRPSPKIKGLPTTHCYRELPWSTHHAPLILQESCSDRTLGGRVWDASLCFLSFLRTLPFGIALPTQSIPSGLRRDQLKNPEVWRALHSSKAHVNRPLMDRLQMYLLNPSSSSSSTRQGQGRQGTMRRVIELGTGCGVVGLALAQLLGPNAHVLLTDLEDVLVETTRPNLALQTTISHVPKAEILVWGDVRTARTIGASKKGRMDLVIGSDIIYNATYHHDLLITLQALLPPHAWFLLGYKPRSPRDESAFFDLLHQAGFRGSIVWSECGLYIWAWVSPNEHGIPFPLTSKELVVEMD